MMRAALVGTLIFAFCTLLRIGLVNRNGLWADEFFSLAMATGHSLEHSANRADPAFGDYVEALRALPPTAYSRYLEHEVPPSSPQRVMRAVFRSDTSPPLYYLLLYAWTRALGTGDSALRYFSVLWSLACFPVFWALAQRLGGRAAAVGTCLLFAVSPTCVFYATEGRMYSLLLLCSVGMLWLTLCLWDRGFSAARFALWVAVGVAGLLTHYFFVFVWCAAVFWLQIQPGQYPQRLSRTGVLLTLLLVLPWYVHLPEIMSQWRVTDYWLWRRPNGYHPVTTALVLPWSFLSIQGGLGWSRSFWSGINFCVFLAVAIGAVHKLSWSLFASPRSLLWLWVLSPCLGMVVFDLLRGTYVVAVPRYALAGLPAALLLAGVSLGSLGRRSRMVSMAFIILLSLMGVRHLYLDDGRNGQNYPMVAKLLAHDVSESDLILVHSIPSGVTGIARYLKHELAPEAHVRFASWVGQLRQRRVPEDLETLAAGCSQIILIRTHDVGEPAPEQSWLEEHAMLVGVKRIHGTTLRYFTPHQSTVFFAEPQ
jgi:uncharacterized membrane protein